MSPGRRRPRAAAGLLLCVVLAFSGTGCGKYGKPVRRSPREHAPNLSEGLPEGISESLSMGLSESALERFTEARAIQLAGPAGGRP